MAPTRQLWPAITTPLGIPIRIGIFFPHLYRGARGTSMSVQSMKLKTHFIALIMGGGPHNNTLPPLPCSAEPTPPEGMAASIISRVTKPVA